MLSDLLPSLIVPAGAFAAALAATAALMGPLVGWLRRRAVLDHPNARSSHRVPTPRGGGLAVSGVILAVWGLVCALTPAVPPVAWAVLAAGLGLAGLSWLDDRHDLSKPLRFAVHLGAVALAVALWPETAPVLGGLLPRWAEAPLVFLAWAWFVNLYNFMDGIDGITGIETASLGGGIALIALLPAGADATVSSSFMPLPALGLAAAGAALAFLGWNWHPAKVFLGDVGSIPLGYLLGFALLALAAGGHPLAALILPAYYLADATLTLVRRAAAGRNILEAHREHFYQRAVHQGGRRHDQVSRHVLAGNLGLIAAAVVAETASAAAGLAVATVIVAALLALFARRAPPTTASEAPTP